MFLYLEDHLRCHKRKEERHHISDAILQFHFRLCLTNSFHGGCFFFQYFCAHSHIYYICTFVWRSFWPRQQCTAIERQSEENNTLSFWSSPMIERYYSYSQAFHSSNYYKKEGRVTGEIGPGQLLLRAALVTTYRRQIVVAITPNRGQTTTTAKRLNSEVPRVRYTPKLPRLFLHLSHGILPRRKWPRTQIYITQLKFS